MDGVYQNRIRMTGRIPVGEIIPNKLPPILNPNLPRAQISTSHIPVVDAVRVTKSEEPLLIIQEFFDNENVDNPQALQTALNGQKITPKVRSYAIKLAAEKGYVEIIKWLLTRGPHQKNDSFVFANVIGRRSPSPLISEKDVFEVVSIALTYNQLQVIGPLLTQVPADLEKLGQYLERQHVNALKFIILGTMESVPELCIQCLRVWKQQLSFDQDTLDHIMTEAIALGSKQICEEIPAGARVTQEQVVFAISNNYRDLASELLKRCSEKRPENIFIEAAKQGYFELIEFILNRSNLIISDEVYGQAFVEAAREGCFQVAEVFLKIGYLPIAAREGALEVARENQQQQFIDKFLTPSNFNISQEILEGYSEEQRSNLVLEAFRYLDKKDARSFIPRLLSSGPISQHARELACVSISRFPYDEHFVLGIARELVSGSISMPNFLSIVRESMRKQHCQVAILFLQAFNSVESVRDFTQEELAAIALLTVREAPEVCVNCISNMKKNNRGTSYDAIGLVLIEAAKRGDLGLLARINEKCFLQHIDLCKAYFEAFENNQEAFAREISRKDSFVQRNAPGMIEALEMLRQSTVNQANRMISVNELEKALSKLERSTLTPDVKWISWKVFFAKISRLGNNAVLEEFEKNYEDRIWRLSITPEISTQHNASSRYVTVVAMLVVFASYLFCSFIKFSLNEIKK